MRTREEALQFGLSFPDTFRDTPFHDPNWQLGRCSDSPSRRIYEAVKRIPYGHVATYAQIAGLAGEPKMARAVGNALHKNPDPEHIPCFRVVNARGELSGAFAFGGPDVQAERLRAEGIEVVDHQVDLQRFQWRPERQA